MKIKHYLAASALAVSAAFVLVSPGAQANDCPGDDTDPSDNSLSIQTPAGGACIAGDPETQTGHVWLDGDGEAPAGGYISVANDDATDRSGVCADDSGGPAADDSDGDGSNVDADESPTCVEAPA